jgi:hypothetical protein
MKSLILLSNVSKMKTMKLWRLDFGLWASHLTLGKVMKASLFSRLIGALMMLAAFSLASCSSDDEEFQTNQLAGTWLRVYDEGVVAEGYVKYTFTPGVPSTSGDCDIYVYDVFTGDTTIHRGYVLNDNRQLVIYEPMYGGTPESQTWNIKKLGSSTMSWERADRSDIIYNFKRAAHQK